MDGGEFRVKVSLLASRGFHMGAKGRIYSVCVCSFMPYRSEARSIKEEYVTRLEMNDYRMVRWMYNVRPEDRIS